jgi:hypothetical protein
MARSRWGTRSRFEADAQAPLVAHLDRRTGETGGAHVLDRDDGAGGHQFEAGFQQALFGEGVAHLHGRALLLDRVVEFGRGHGRAAHAVAARLGAEIDDGHADARGGRVEDRVRVGEAGGEGVDEAVAVVGAVEADLSAHGRHAEGVAVAADAFHDALHEMRGLGVRGSPKDSAFIAAMGRAPMVKTSRRMPPTPVAAPW